MKAHTLRSRLLVALRIALYLAPLAAGAADLGSSIVTIKVTSQGYDYYSPWRKRPPSQSEIQGCVIEGGLILTVAHPLLDHVLVEVSKHGSPRKYPAEVALKDYVSGLALVRVSDPSFHADITPAALAAPATPPEGLRIARWETGGVLREFTASRIKTMVDYFTPLGATLAHVLSTDMDRGGSGEPVFAGDKLLGLAYYLEPSSKNLKVCAVEAIRRMLADLADGRYDGYPSVWEYARGLEGDRNLKGYLGMGEQETGVLVTEVPPRMSGAGILRTGDVILEVDGRQIDDSGLYRSSSYGSLHYESLLFLDHQVGDTVALRILRGGARMQVSVPLLPLDGRAFLVPLLSADTPPEYVVFGGLVLQELSASYLQGAWGNDWWRAADSRLLYYYQSFALLPEADRSRIVLLNRVLPHAANAGYQSESNLILSSFNGTRVRDLAHLASLLAGSTEPYAVFELAGGDRIVLSFERARAAEKEIMSLYGLPASSFVAGPPRG